MGKRQITAPVVAREPDGKWLPGQSPNPGGLPTWVREFREIMRNRCAPLAEKHLFRVLGGQEKGQSEDPMYESLTADDRTKAARVVLELVLPKPKQSVAVTHAVSKYSPLEGMVVADLVALAKAKTTEET